MRPRVRLGTLFSSTVVGYVHAGLGIALTDPFAVMGPGTGALTVRPFRPRLPFQFSAIYRDRDERTGLSAQFAATVRQVTAAALRDLKA